MMGKEVEVTITGKRFVFQLADDVPPEEFLQVVEYVENKINKIKSRMNELDAQKLGLLTSINIAQDLFSLKKENEKLAQILGRIDTLLSPESEDGKLTVSLSS
ncbi:MAG TPA: cell division protein ZapA [Candidatus Aminicenantes bacterium]|jgi:cell division protein ZapA (FtsZ GTPase activity inhibitor)|nr:cell division protein ZapA [Candidatus Aminicenantes bacterium]